METVIQRKMNYNKPNFDTIKYFLLDMDGTFYIGDKIIPGSLTFIEKLKKSNRDFHFITNNNSRNSNYYVKKLRSMGLDIDQSKIFTSGEATGIFLMNNYPGSKVFVIGNEYLKEDLQRFGLKIVEKEPDLVIVGFDTTLTYEKLRKGCWFIEQGIPYIATHPDKFCPSLSGKLPDCGGITAAIEVTTGISPKLVVGKPNKEMVGSVISKLGTIQNSVAMCGDRLATDIQMALNAGITSCLVLSGETNKELLSKSKIKPTYVFENLGEIIPFL